MNDNLRCFGATVFSSLFGNSQRWVYQSTEILNPKTKFPSNIKTPRSKNDYIQGTVLQVRKDKDGVAFWIVVRPRSGTNEIVDIREGVLRVRVTAPTREGAANEACRNLLSKTLGISKTSISIRKGEKSTKKLIHCLNLTPQDLTALIQK